ncbi:MAG: SpoIID/LytB domain-containing protein [Bacteroidota bacterium]
MISREPVIRVGIFENQQQISGEFQGAFELNDSLSVDGLFRMDVDGEGISFQDSQGLKLPSQKEIVSRPHDTASFVLHDVTIGVHFHWERKEQQAFHGNLHVVRDNNGLTAINEIGVEEYLKSVISSEMSATAPIELLKAHAITSRSWLVAMLEREKKNVGVPSQRSQQTADEIIRWYDREDHALFDVCADDHCQRYQGISKIISQAANDAVEETQGMFLVYENEICDARYSKACGGISESYENAWEDRQVPYLSSISDWKTEYAPLKQGIDTEQWILGAPDAYCNTKDGNILKQVLPSFDQETTDFFRWKVTYKRGELEEIVRDKSGIDVGVIRNLVPMERGPSGRITKLKIKGLSKSVIVGKELEIRRWLSRSHLYSSAFVVRKEGERFVLYGAGWGHGVGLCQIGAAVMATKGFKAEEIVKHYFRGAELKKLY